MPIHNDVDEKGHYYQWGQHGHKYYYKCPKNPGKQCTCKTSMSRDRAKRLAIRQMQAAYVNGY